jgi:hypothetical protein
VYHIVAHPELYDRLEQRLLHDCEREGSDSTVNAVMGLECTKEIRLARAVEVAMDYGKADKEAPD